MFENMQQNHKNDIDEYLIAQHRRFESFLKDFTKAENLTEDQVDDVVRYYFLRMLNGASMGLKAWEDDK